MSLFMRNLPVVTAFFGSSAVFAGAYGSHSGKFSDLGLSMWRTAVQYQLIHTLALVGLTFSGKATSSQAGKVAAHLFSFGILGFCFGIYTSCLLPAQSWLKKISGPITPIGGTTLIAAWLSLGWIKA